MRQQGMHRRVRACAVRENRRDESLGRLDFVGRSQGHGGLFAGAPGELRKRRELAGVCGSRHGRAAHEKTTDRLACCEGRESANGSQAHTLITEQRSVDVERPHERLRSGEVVERTDPMHAPEPVFARGGGKQPLGGGDAGVAGERGGGLRRAGGWLAWRGGGGLAGRDELGRSSRRGRNDRDQGRDTRRTPTIPKGFHCFFSDGSATTAGGVVSEPSTRNPMPARAAPGWSCTADHPTVSATPSRNV